jgi:hypothetical protein
LLWSSGSPPGGTAVDCKAFHHDVCTEAKKVTATGTIKKVDGKNEFTASRIELVK